MIKDALDFELFSDSIYGDEPKTLQGFFNLDSFTIPVGSQGGIGLEQTTGFIRFGNASGYPSKKDFINSNSVISLGLYVSYSTRGF